MSGWYRLVLPGLFLAAQFALTAQNLDDAARDLARQVVSAVGLREPVFVAVRNLSALGAGEVAEVRRTLEAELRSQGMRLLDRQGNPEVSVTLTENLSRYLVVAELRRGEERQVLITSAGRQTAPANVAPAASMVIEKKLVWEQEQPILDVAFTANPGEPAGLLVLDPEKITLYAWSENRWQARQSQAVPAGRPWPRDPRGRLMVNAAAFQAYLPGMLCRGLTQPALSMECKDSEDGWPLDSGTRLLGLAGLAPGHNYFDGRLVTAPGGPRRIPAFFSAAAVEEQGTPLWLFAGVDGRTHLYSATWEPAGTVTQWGSDLAGLDAPCGSGHQVLATQPGEASEPDTVQAFEMVHREAIPASPTVSLPGPVTALWPAGRASAFAISRDPDTRRYAAFRLSLACGS